MLLTSTLLSFARPRRLFVAVVAAIATTGIILQSQATLADLAPPQASERRVTLIVAGLMGRQHLTKHPLDDEISERFLDNFVDSLDRMKLYFLQSDMDEFEKSRKQLDDQVRVGDIAFSRKVFNRLLQRMDERIKVVDELLSQQHDFTKEEFFVTDPEAMQFANNAEEAKERWRKRVKYDLLRLKVDDKVEGADAVDRLRRKYHGVVRRMKQLNGDDLLEMYLTAMTTSYDPHTTYMSATTHENFLINMRLRLEGIGARISDEDGIATITGVIEGGAAAKDGRMKKGDQIVAVAQGGSDDFVATAEMKLDDIVGLIRGKGGTVVRIKVHPGGAKETVTYDLTRSRVEIKDSAARGEIIEDGKKPDGTPYKVGVVDLPSFYMDIDGARRGKPNYRSTTRDVKKILTNFRAKGVDAVIVDLRSNPGGSLPESINMTGLFIDQGPVVQVKKPGRRSATLQ